MRKIDEIANEKFNGDINRTLYYLVYEAGEPFDPYIPELTQAEAATVLRFVEDRAIKHYGSEENYYNEYKKRKLLAQLDLTEEEVRNAKKNPYKAKLLKNSLLMLIVEGGILALGLAANQMGIAPDILSYAGSIATGLFSMTLAGNLLEYVRFKKTKKMIDVQDQRSMTEDNSRGRGM
ncbi:MAG: hypothetical protein IKT40_06345 [Bacilli bacterium]|nr:hypothetical protein [Bacilli bacterium]